MGKEHWVVCKVCGRKVDIERVGGSYDGSRYTCKHCLDAIKKQRKQVENAKANKSGWFKKYWKLLFGIIFLIGGLGSIGAEWKTAIFGTAVGIGLLLWYFWPNIIKTKAAVPPLPNLQNNPPEFHNICKSCGATVKGSTCDYCGAPFNTK